MNIGGLRYFKHILWICETVLSNHNLISQCVISTVTVSLIFTINDDRIRKQDKNEIIKSSDVEFINLSSKTNVNWPVYTVKNVTIL